ncbi:MAG: lysophospholipid acyltransferase family protein [Thermodesulfobacteriota bacterium]|nr:lysophospholipid acyltransferase family protein [Thermodesulfobacteriota bacterium]
MSALYAFYTERLQRSKRGALFLMTMNFFLITAIVFWTFAGLLLFPLAFIFLKFAAGKSTQWITRWCIWIYGRVWQFFTSLFVTFGPALYRPDQFTVPGIIVANHRSFFDTYCMNMLPVYDVCFVVRDWPFKIPVYNIFMYMAAYMNIEKFSWEKCIERSRQTLARGGFVLFFPEGHRSRTWRMTRFYSGAFKMAVETGAPIIPICLTGTEDLLPPGRKYMAPARIKMKVLKPVNPKDFQGKMKQQQMKKKVKQLMSEELVAMEGCQISKN